MKEELEHGVMLLWILVMKNDRLITLCKRFGDVFQHYQKYFQF